MKFKFKVLFMPGMHAATCDCVVIFYYIILLGHKWMTFLNLNLDPVYTQMVPVHSVPLIIYSPFLGQFLSPGRYEIFPGCFT